MSPTSVNNFVKNNKKDFSFLLFKHSFLMFDHKKIIAVRAFFVHKNKTKSGAHHENRPLFYKRSVSYDPNTPVWRKTLFAVCLAVDL